MELRSKTYGKIIGSAPRLDTVLMVEAFIEKHSGEYNSTQIFKSLPKKMMWRTFKIILAYLDNTNKIVMNKDGTLTWVWDPDGVAKYLSKKNLRIQI